MGIRPFISSAFAFGNVTCRRGKRRPHVSPLGNVQDGIGGCVSGLITEFGAMPSYWLRTFRATSCGATQNTFRALVRSDSCKIDNYHPKEVHARSMQGVQTRKSKYRANDRDAMAGYTRACLHRSCALQTLCASLLSEMAEELHSIAA